jgi:hypothetical protein
MDALAIIQRSLVPAIEGAGFNAQSLDSTSSNDVALQFSNGKVRLDLFFSQQTNELFLNFEHPASNSVGVPLARFLEREGDPDADWTGGLILRGSERSEAALTRLSEAIDRNAHRLASISATDVTKLYEHWLAVGRMDTRRKEVSRKVAQAEALWHDGNYPQCARVLSAIESDLSPAQRKRLELARLKTQSL